jgi:hypothetical protein
MKTKKMITALGIAMVLGLVFTLNVQAVEAWYSCTVDMVGPGWGVAYIQLTDTAGTPAFTNKWCVLSSTQEKELLAVVLTALTNDLNVMVYVDPAVSYPTVSAVYLQK